MIASILDSVKKALSIPSDYDVFDSDITMHINSTFATLTQVGIGPSVGFMIEDDSTTWDELLYGDASMNFVKTYVYIKVRLLFDPPTVASTTTALKEQSDELLWRISVNRENGIHGNVPDSNSYPHDRIFDGGTPSGVPRPSSVVYDGGKP